MLRNLRDAISPGGRKSIGRPRGRTALYDRKFHPSDRSGPWRLLLRPR